jgi:hypothetical protein
MNLRSENRLLAKPKPAEQQDERYTVDIEKCHWFGAPHSPPERKIFAVPTEAPHSPATASAPTNKSLNHAFQYEGRLNHRP